MIQLKLKFQLEKPELPRELDRMTVSFLKASLEKYCTELFLELYDKSKSTVKPYTYSYQLPGAVFQGEKILLKKKEFTLFFCDADLGQTIHFVNAFKQMLGERYPMNRNSMKLIQVKVEERKEIKDSEVIIKMQSSLIVRRHNSLDNTDIYYTYEHPEFEKVLRENITVLLQKLSIPISAEDFKITPIKGKKIVATVFGRKIDANIGIYKISGNSKLLNLLYQTGIGARRSEGHGKFEVIG